MNVILHMQSVIDNLARELEVVKHNERKLTVQTKVSEMIDSFISTSADQLKSSITDMLNKHIITAHPKDTCSHNHLWDRSMVQCNLPYANSYRNTFGYKIRDDKLIEPKTDNDRLCTNIEYDIKSYVNDQVGLWIDGVNGKIADYIRSTIAPDIETLVSYILKRDSIMKQFTERRMSEILDCSFDTSVNKSVLTELVRTALSDSFGIDDQTVVDSTADAELGREPVEHQYSDENELVGDQEDCDREFSDAGGADQL